MVQATRAFENDVTGLYNAAFARLREVSVTYILPGSWVRAFRASSGSVSVAGRNLMMLWTGTNGFNTPRDGHVMITGTGTQALGDQWTWDPELRNPSQVQSDYTVYTRLSGAGRRAAWIASTTWSAAESSMIHDSIGSCRSGSCSSGSAVPGRSPPSGATARARMIR